MVLLFDGLWYSSAAALDLLGRMLVLGVPHKTPDGRAALVFDRGGYSSTANGTGGYVPPCLIPQGIDGHNLLTVTGDRITRIQLDPSDLADLKRLVEFDHLPEERKAGALKEGLHKAGDKLA